jgi:large conductance mechanosensitive channel
MDYFRSQERQLLGSNGEREWREYKRFAFKDDMLKLSVGIMLGNAFNKVVQSVSDNLAMPALSFLTLNTGEAWRDWSWSPVGGLDIRLGRLAGDALDFLVVSAVLYLVYVKFVGKVFGRWMPPAATKQCLLCMERIHPEAVKCKFCGGNPNGIKRRNRVKDKGSKDGGGKSEGPDRAGGKDRNGSKGSGEFGGGSNRGRGVPKYKRKRK